MGVGIAVLTVYFSFSFIKRFIPKISKPLKPKGEFMYNHKWIGLILVFGMAFQVISGFISRYSRKSAKIHPNFCIWWTRIHIFFSYGIVCLGKYNYLSIAYHDDKI